MFFLSKSHPCRMSPVSGRLLSMSRWWISDNWAKTNRLPGFSLHFTTQKAEGNRARAHLARFDPVPVTHKSVSSVQSRFCLSAGMTARCISLDPELLCHRNSAASWLAPEQLTSDQSAWARACVVRRRSTRQRWSESSSTSHRHVS